MKRNMDLAREILLAIEGYEEPNSWVPIESEDFSKEEISFHIKILAQAGLIEANDVSAGGDFDWQAKSLTWEGCEFLDAARNDSRWKKAKDFILSKGGSLTLEILKTVLSEEIRKAVMGI